MKHLSEKISIWFSLDFFFFFYGTSRIIAWFCFFCTGDSLTIYDMNKDTQDYCICLRNQRRIKNMNYN